MARHNRLAEGVDQCGYSYEISYQPDWLARVKVTRRLPTGRRSTKVLFRNPARKPAETPPHSVRVSIASSEQRLRVESTMSSSAHRIREARIVWAGPGKGHGPEERVTFTLIPFRRPPGNR